MCLLLLLNYSCNYKSLLRAETTVFAIRSSHDDSETRGDDSDDVMTRGDVIVMTDDVILGTSRTRQKVRKHGSTSASVKAPAAGARPARTTTP